MRSFILCSSSLTPGRLKPTLRPRGCLNTGFSPGFTTLLGFGALLFGFGAK
jgi:hypothetical protein